MYRYNDSNEYSKLENTFEYQANIQVYRIFKQSSHKYTRLVHKENGVVMSIRTILHPLSLWVMRLVQWAQGGGDTAQLTRSVAAWRGYK